jgi:hypothetical protein
VNVATQGRFEFGGRQIAEAHVRPNVVDVRQLQGYIAPH